MFKQCRTFVNEAQIALTHTHTHKKAELNSFVHCYQTWIACDRAGSHLKMPPHILTEEAAVWLEILRLYSHQTWQIRNPHRVAQQLNKTHCMTSFVFLLGRWTLSAKSTVAPKMPSLKMIGKCWVFIAGLDLVKMQPKAINITIIKFFILQEEPKTPLRKCWY